MHAVTTTYPATASRSAWRMRLEATSLPTLLGFATLSIAWLHQGDYLPWTSFQKETLAALGGLLLCWAALERCARVVWPVPALVALVLAAVPLLQYGAQQIRFLTDAVLASAYLVALALSVCVAATMVSGPRKAQLLDGWTGACVVAAIVSTGMALYQWLDLPSLGDWLSQGGRGRPFANLNQPNHLSSLLALGVVGVLQWFETRRIGRWVAVLAVGWLAWGIVMTESRTGWMFVGLLTVGTLLIKLRARLRTHALAVVAGALLFVGLVMAHGVLRTAWSQSTDVSAVRTAVGTRYLHWTTLADAASKSPWVGYGWNQVPHAQLGVALQHPASGEAVPHSHNLILDLAVENGIPVAVLLLAGGAWWLSSVIRRCDSGETWYLIAGVLALLAHAMVEYPLHYAYFLIPAGLMFGAIDVLTRPSTAMPWRGRKVTLWVPALLMGLLLVWVGTEYIRAEEALRRLRFASARIGITMADLRSPNLTLLDSWKAYHDAATIQPMAGMSTADVRLLRDAAQRYPYPNALYRYARALAANGDPNEARQTLRYLCKLHPPPVQVALREAWQELQEREQSAKSVEFPDCSRE